MPVDSDVIRAFGQSVCGSISTIVGSFKSAVSKQIGISVWQRGFYDHVIRNDQDYDRIANYIVDNPANWDDDDENV